MATKSNSTKVTTGKVRLSWPHLFEAYAFEDEDPKFSTMLLIPKSDTKTYDALRAAEEAAKERGKQTKWGGKVPKSLTSIIKDGDEYSDDYPERAGHWFMAVRSKTRPGVVDKDVQPITDQSEIYSGVFARVSLSAFPFKFGGTSGVSFGLGNVQKLADGESLGGATRAEEDFDALDDEDDDLI